MTLGFTIFLVCAGIIALVVLAIIGIYNNLVHHKNYLDEGWSGIEVQLKRRYDLIPNLVAVAKQYGVHEQSIFEKIATMRAAAINAHGIEQKSSAENMLSHTLKTLFSVVENYPNLKASDNFLALSKELTTIEQDIQLARRYFNGTARNYNILVQSFPSSVIASYMGFRRVSFFEVVNETEREVPHVRF